MKPLFCLILTLGLLRVESSTLYDKKIDEILYIIRTDKGTLPSVDSLRSILDWSSQNYGNKKGIVLLAIAEKYASLFKFDSAYFYYDESEKIIATDTLDFYLGKIYLGKTLCFTKKDNFPEAIAYGLKAEKVFRKSKNDGMIAHCLRRIAVCFSFMDDYESSLAYLKQSLLISEKQKDTLNIIKALTDLATPYDELKKYREAELSLNKAIELGKNTRCTTCLAYAYSQMGILMHNQNKFEKAIFYYQKESEMNKISGDIKMQFHVYQNISEALIGLNKSKSALKYNDTALYFAQKSLAPKRIHDAYKIKYQLQKQLGNPTMALEALELQIVYRDSIYTSDKAKAIEELKLRYETELKEEQIKDLEQANIISILENKQANQRNWLLLFGLVSILGIALVLYFMYAQKRKNADLFNQKNVELERLNIFKDRMFAVISHDLRNPVNAFQFIIQGLNQNIDHVSKEELKDFLATTLQAAIDLKSLLNNLLEWALVQIGKLPFKPEIVSVNEIIDDCIQHLQSIANAKNIIIESSIDQEIALGDKNMIVIIVRNFLSNAIKFSSLNSKIKFYAKSTPETILISIQDFGIGMKEHDVAKLLKPDSDVFSIGNSSEKGAGIGLMLCKELASRNEGKIFIESKWGEGSIFTLELPKP